MLWKNLPFEPLIMVIETNRDIAIKNEKLKEVITETQGKKK